jgi:phosphatidylglycerophosphate synthase
VTQAVLFATARTPDGPAALLELQPGLTVIERLRSQLEALGVDRLVVLARPGDGAALRQHGFVVTECAGPAEELHEVARLAGEASGRLVLCAADLVAADTAVRAVIAARGFRSTALISRSADPGELHPAVRAQRGRLVLVEPGAVPATADFRGLLVAKRAQLAAALDSARESAAAAPDALTAVLAALVAGEAPVGVQRVPGLPYGRVADAEAAADLVHRLLELDEEQVRLRVAVKRRDDLFATYFVSSYSPYLVRWAARRGLTPTVVTWLSVLTALLAGAGFAQGSRWFWIAGALGLYVSFVLDCVDGQLARYLQQYSRYGGWLDTIADRGKEYAVYAALAIGAARAGIGDLWPMAIAAMVLLTVRHMTDTWYGALQDEAVRRRAAAAGPAGTVSAGSVSAGSLTMRLGARLGQVSDRVQADRTSLAYWVKRTLPFPIGERWLVIGLATAIFDARVAFVVLLTWGGVAAAYTFAGRVLRTRQMRVPVMASVDHALYRDDGVLARLLGRLGHGVLRPLPVSLLPAVVALLYLVQRYAVPLDVPLAYFLVAGLAAAAVAGLASSHPHSGPLDWLVPAALRASEYGVILLVTTYGGVSGPLAYGLLAVLALYHYDLTARLERRSSPLVWRSWALGWDGRLLVLGLGTALGITGATVWALTAYLCVVFVGGSVMGNYGERRRPPRVTPTQRNGDLPVPVRH